MQRLQIGISASVLICFAAVPAQCGGKKTTTDALGSPRPPIEAEIQAVLRPDRTVAISVTIPAEHHAYLDSGKDGMFIPIAFRWEELVKSGALSGVPRATSAPRGVLDEEMGAHLLRGPGEFVFGPLAGKPEGQSLRVRTQLCNDRTRVCYPPSTQAVSLGSGS